MNPTSPTSLDAARITRAQRAALPLSTEVAQALAEQHGVCVQPLAMRRIDTTTAGPGPTARLFTGPRGGQITTAVLRDATHWDEVVATL